MKLFLLLALFQQGGLDSDLAALVARVPPPRAGGPSVFLVVSTDRIYVGDQLNVLTAAWLPRSLRLRLRQAPTLTPPVLAGVWSTPRPATPGAVATRELVEGGESYDLFVAAQTVYPLNPGPLQIPPARLGWVRPATGSRTEDRPESALSSSLLAQVRPLPAAGRPPQFSGPVARNLAIDYRLGAGAGRAGAVLPVDVVLTGSGSLPLWPPPTMAWPMGMRAYDQGTETAFLPAGVRLAGTRRFRFGVVPDSAGGLSLPALEYPYFDPGSATYRVARTPAIVVPILEAAPLADHRSPVPVVEPGAPSLAARLFGLPGYVLWGLGLAPPLLIAALALGRRLRRRERPAAEPASLEQLERMVRALLPPGTGARPRTLLDALRNAGLDRADAARLVNLYLAVEAARYRPDPDRHPLPDEGEIGRALDAVPGRLRQAAGAPLLLLALLGGAAGPAPAQSGTEHYMRQEYSAAAQAFEREARSDPSPYRWYNLAAAEYMSRRDAHAAAALLAARAEVPRDPRARALWNALAREHQALRRALPPAAGALPLSAAECFALALLVAWLAVPAYLVARRKPALWGGTLALAAALALLGQSVLSSQQGERAVLLGGASLRVSPHGLAPAAGGIPAFTVVRLIRPSGTWWLVSAEDTRGWVPGPILAPSPAPPAGR